MEFITSDLHLDHEKVLQINNRPYASLPDMRESLIDDINALPKGSTLYHCGDFVLGSKKRLLLEILKRITTNVIWILGNHDHRLKNVFAEFGEVYNVHEITFDNIKIVMNHFPQYEWNRGQNGSIHFHGHTHGHFQGPGKMLDVGWDNHGKILTMEEAVKIADANPIYQPCHSRNNGLHRHELEKRY